MSNINETRIVLGSLKYKSSPNSDLGIKLPLEQSELQYIEYDRNLNVDLAQIFDQERQLSTVIRPSTKIVFITKNAYSGTTSYPPFLNNMYYVDEAFYASLQNQNPNTVIKWGGFPQYNEFDFIRTDYDVSGYTQPPNNHINFVNKSATTYNWNLFVSYAYNNNYNKKLQWHDPNRYQWVAKDGIPYVMTAGTSNGSNLISFYTPVPHGLSVGEYIYLLDSSGLPIFYNGNSLFQVYSLGNNIFGTEENYVNIFDYGFTGNTFTNGNIGSFKRVIDIANSAETMSKYYVREHKILTNVDDAILTKSGFEWNSLETSKKYENRVYTPNNYSRISIKEGNQTYTLTFSRDIDISPLRDNQMRPITELYFTIIHKGFFGWFYEPYTNFTSAMKEGHEFNLPLWTSTAGFLYPSNWWRRDQAPGYTQIPYKSYTTFIDNITNTFYYNDSLKSGDTISGPFCEWNDFDQKERVVSDYIHKIYYNHNVFDTLNNNSTVVNPYGFYYLPHTPLTIRVFSDYIEEGTDAKTTTYPTGDIPDYSYYSKFRGAFRWRDIYTYGFIDQQGNGVDYPFLNGVHHPYKNTIFRLIPEGSNFLNQIYAIEDPLTDDCE